VITDVLGGNAGTRSYDPYRTQTVQTGNWNDAFGTPYATLGWAGEYKDTDTGFTYLRARHYDPATGQFLQNDPVSGGSCNTHEYGCANPLTNTDPTGASTCGGGWGWNPYRWVGVFQDCVALAAREKGYSGNFVVGVCAAGSGSFVWPTAFGAGVTGGVEGCLLVDGHGDYGATASAQHGVGLGTSGGSITVGPTLSLARKIEDVRGTASGIAASVGKGLGVYGSISRSSACDYTYGSGSVGVGGGIGGWVGVYREDTLLTSNGRSGRTLGWNRSAKWDC
jgi:RHS repeat-associated protein